MKKHVYLASGWFNPTQMKMMEEIYVVLQKFHEEINVFAPYYNGVVLKPDDPREKWQEVFELDTEKILWSNFMVANIEGFEPGTIFEVGCAFAWNVPVIAYSSVKGRGLNVMLAQSCIGFANSPEELEHHIRVFLDNPGVDRINRWEGIPI